MSAPRIDDDSWWAAPPTRHRAPVSDRERERFVAYVGWTRDEGMAPLDAIARLDRELPFEKEVKR